MDRVCRSLDFRFVAAFDFDDLSAFNRFDDLVGSDGFVLHRFLRSFRCPLSVETDRVIEDLPTFKWPEAMSSEIDRVIFDLEGVRDRRHFPFDLEGACFFDFGR